MTMTYVGRPIDSVSDECDECGATGLLAKLASAKICGDCCERGRNAAGAESSEDAKDDEISDLKADLETAKEERKELERELEAERAKASDAEAALHGQEECAADLARKLDAVKRTVEGLPLLPEPKPRKPRAKKPAEVSP